jgi:endonuclease/exonuclease/phosphatase family metal-dependent hydrolase
VDRLPRIVAVLSFVAAACALVTTFIAAGEDERLLRVATFNIEYYPKSEAQAQRALDVIGALDAPLVAVQEITAPYHLANTARARLGDAWRLVVVNHRMATGVLFDTRRFALVSTHTHVSTVVIPAAIPVFEVRFDDVETRERVRVFVVHWKAGGDNFPARKQQMDAFAPILDAARGSGDRIVVLGDFNATGDDDRVRIGALAKNARVEWATRALGCTCFWQRERDCVGSALDHILTTERVRSVRAAGECAKGCPTTDRCPAWRDEVSDHCPVVVDLVRR